MNLLIQLHFQNGLGNLYTAVVQLLHFANYYKKLGYKCHFVFACKSEFNGNGWGLDKINIDEIFDMDSFDVFDDIKNIERPIMDKEYNGYTFYGGKNPSGVWWDVFFLQEIDKFYQLSYGNHDAHIFSNRDFIPEKIPKFNKKIIDKVNNFKIKFPHIDSSIQLRLFGFNDELNQSEILHNVYSEIYKSVKDSNKTFFLTSSRVSCLGKILDLPNIVLFDSRISNISYGDTRIFDNRETRINFLQDNIAEMVILAENDFVYHMSVLPWVSTYLYYAFVNNPKLSIKKINEIN
jgi:hypothetical protein